MYDIAARMPKWCSHCGEMKMWADFPADCTKPDGYGYWCKECRNAAARARYHEDVEWSRRYKRMEYRRNGGRRRAERQWWREWRAMFEEHLKAKDIQ